MFILLHYTTVRIYDDLYWHFDPGGIRFRTTISTTSHLHGSAGHYIFPSPKKAQQTSAIHLIHRELTFRRCHQCVVVDGSHQQFPLRFRVVFWALFLTEGWIHSPRKLCSRPSLTVVKVKLVWKRLLLGPWIPRRSYESYCCDRNLKGVSTVNINIYAWTDLPTKRICMHEAFMLDRIFPLVEWLKICRWSSSLRRVWTMRFPLELEKVKCNLLAVVILYKIQSSSD